jgi:hypothetical protein
MMTWDGDGTLLENLLADSDVLLDDQTLASCFTPTRALRNTDTVFTRLASSVLA